MAHGALSSMNDSNHGGAMIKEGGLKTIGLIGVGLLGNAIALRLSLGGISPIVFDGDPLKMDSLTTPPFVKSKDAVEVFASSKVVFLCLPDSKIVNQVIHANLSSLTKGMIIFDATTGNPKDTIALALELSAMGIQYLDTTVSGSSVQVSSGEAMMMVGGCRESFEQSLELLKLVARKVFYTGASGTASQIKLVSNLVLGLNRAALAEGLILANAFGLDLVQVLYLLRESAAYSRIMDTKGEKMIHAEFEPQAKLAQHMKDVSLMLDAADEMKISLPFSETHFDILERGKRLGMGDLDNSAILKVIESLGKGLGS